MISGVSAFIAVLALMVSALVGWYTHKDRWARLKVSFIGGDYFSAKRGDLGASLIVFNPSSRPNSIVQIQISVTDTVRTDKLYSLPAQITFPEEGTSREMNRIPEDVGPGSGVRLDVYSHEYRAFRFDQHCFLIVVLTDVYGNTFRVRHSFVNRWPRTQFPHDVN